MAEEKKAEETKDAAITSNQTDVEPEKIDKESKQIELKDLEHRLNESTQIIKESSQIISEYLAANNKRAEVEKNYNEKETKLKELLAQLEQYLNRLPQRTQGLEGKVQTQQTEAGTVASTQPEQTSQYQQPQTQSQTQKTSNSNYTVKLGRLAVFTPYFVVRNNTSGKKYKIQIGKSGELRLPQDLPQNVASEVSAAINDFAEKNKSDVDNYVQSFYGKKK